MLGTTDVDDHRLQRTPVTAMNRRDRPCGRCCETHTRRLLVLEEDLSAVDVVAHRHPHRRSQTDEVSGQQRHATRGSCAVHLLRWRTDDRKTQPLLDAM